MMGAVGDQDRVEAVYRAVHPRLWRSLLAYTGDAELASDAEAEAFAQVLRRGDAVDDVEAWVWRSAFRIAVGSAGGEVELDRSRTGGWFDAVDRFGRRVLGPVGRPVPAAAGLRRVALRRRVHVTRDRRAARDQCGHGSGAAESGPCRRCATRSRRPSMRDDFDSVVADRFKVLDDVPVPDTWSRVQSNVLDRMPVQFTEEEVTMIDLETPSQTDEHRKGPKRVVVAGLLAAAAVVAIALVAIRNDDPVSPADQPSPTVTVPDRAAASAVRHTRRAVRARDVLRRRGRRSHRRRGSPSPSATGGRTDDGWASVKEGTGFMTFSRPDRVFVDACHPIDGFHPGPLTTLDGLVAALSEQGGWAEVTAPSDISVDGYVGKAFQRTAPAEFTDCSTALPRSESWENDLDDGGPGWSYYEPGEIETLWVLDVNGTIIIINTRLGRTIKTPPPSPNSPPYSTRSASSRRSARSRT